MQRVAAIVDGERRDPVRSVGRQVRGAHRAAVLSGVRFEFFGQGSLVERRSPGCRDLLESLRMLRETKEFAWPRRAAVRDEGLGETRLRLQLRHLLRPLAGDGGRDENAIAPVAV